jgi:hypothetical protein
MPFVFLPKNCRRGIKKFLPTGRLFSTAPDPTKLPAPVRRCNLEGLASNRYVPWREVSPVGRRKGFR